MADISKLMFGDNESSMYSSEYRIKDCRCIFNRTYECCLPREDVRCEEIEVTVVAPGKSDLNLIEWYIDGTQLSGKILFAITGGITTQDSFCQEVFFENAFCSQISESYDIAGSSQRLLRLTIVPLLVKVLDVSFPRPS